MREREANPLKLVETLRHAYNVSTEEVIRAMISTGEVMKTAGGVATCRVIIITER